jgi:hypothetical protein
MVTSHYHKISLTRRSGSKDLSNMIASKNRYGLSTEERGEKIRLLGSNYLNDHVLHFLDITALHQSSYIYGLIIMNTLSIIYCTYKQRQPRAWSWTLIYQLLKRATVCQIRVAVSCCLYQVHLSAILTLLIPISGRIVHFKNILQQETLPVILKLTFYFWVMSLLRI